MATITINYNGDPTELYYWVEQVAQQISEGFTSGHHERGTYWESEGLDD